jgi:hypothetical protein
MTDNYRSGPPDLRANRHGKCAVRHTADLSKALAHILLEKHTKSLLFWAAMILQTQISRLVDCLAVTKKSVERFGDGNERKWNFTAADCVVTA